MRSNNRDLSPFMTHMLQLQANLNSGNIQYVVIFFNFVQKSVTSLPCVYSVFEIIGPLPCFYVCFYIYSSSSLAKWEKHRGTL